MQRALGVYDVAGKAYYELYKSEAKPDYLQKAALCFIEAQSWTAAKSVIEYLCLRPEYRSIFPDFAQKLAMATHIDDLFTLSRLPAKTVDDRLMPWLESETHELRHSILKVFIVMATHWPETGNISRLATVGLAYGFEAMAANAIKSLPTQHITKWFYLANLYSALGDHEEAKNNYCRAMEADSTLPEVVPKAAQKEFPIVLLHRGPAKFVEYSLRSLRRHHPTRRIVLLCDDHQRYDPELGIEYRQWATYNAAAKSLARNYRHSTINLFSFELVCLERWLVLEDFCCKHGINEVLHFDTDVLVFDSFDDLETTFRSHEAMICRHQPGVAYLRLEALRCLSENIQKFFKGESVFAEDEQPRRISDMTFCYNAARARRWGDLLTHEDEGLIDNHIHSSDGFRMDGKIKHFEFIDSQPFATQISSGEKVRFRSIHFQGPAKRLIKDYLERAYGKL